MKLTLNKAEANAVHLAVHLTDEALAERLRMMAQDPRAFGKVTRDAFLFEAARRLELEVTK